MLTSTLVLMMEAAIRLGCAPDDVACQVCRHHAVFVGRLTRIGSTMDAPETEETIVLRELGFSVLRELPAPSDAFAHNGHLTVHAVDNDWRPRGHTLRVGWRYVIVVTEIFEGTLPATVLLLTPSVRSALATDCAGYETPSG